MNSFPKAIAAAARNITQIVQLNHGGAPESIPSTCVTLRFVVANEEGCASITAWVKCPLSLSSSPSPPPSLDPHLRSGCSGALAKQCTSAYPECTVTIFDLPKVVDTSREHFLIGADRRISYCEGDVIAADRKTSWHLRRRADSSSAHARVCTHTHTAHVHPTN